MCMWDDVYVCVMWCVGDVCVVCMRVQYTYYVHACGVCVVDYVCVCARYSVCDTVSVSVCGTVCV